MPRGTKHLNQLFGDEIPREEEENQQNKSVLDYGNYRYYIANGKRKYDEDDSTSESSAASELRQHAQSSNKKNCVEYDTSSDEADEETEERGTNQPRSKLFLSYPSVSIRQQQASSSAAAELPDHTKEELHLARFMSRQSRKNRAYWDIIKSATTTQSDEVPRESALTIYNKEPTAGVIRSDEVALDVANNTTTTTTTTIAATVGFESNANMESTIGYNNNNEVINGQQYNVNTNIHEFNQVYDPTEGIDSSRQIPPYTPSPKRRFSNSRQQEEAIVYPNKIPLTSQSQYMIPYNQNNYNYAEERRGIQYEEKRDDRYAALNNNYNHHQHNQHTAGCIECDRLNTRFYEMDTTKTVMIATTLDYASRCRDPDDKWNDRINILRDNLLSIYEKFEDFIGVKFGLTGMKIESGEYMRYGDQYNIEMDVATHSSYMEIPFMGGIYGYAFLEFNFRCEPMAIIYNKKIDIVKVIREVIFKSRDFWKFKIQGIFAESERNFQYMDSRVRNSMTWNDYPFYSPEFMCFHPHCFSRMFFAARSESPQFSAALRVNDVYITTCTMMSGATYKEYDVRRRGDNKQLGFGLDLSSFSTLPGELNVRPLYDKSTGNAFALVSSIGNFGPVFDGRMQNSTTSILMECLFGKSKINMAHLQMDSIFDISEYMAK